MKNFMRGALAVATGAVVLLSSACTVVNVADVGTVNGEKVYKSAFEYMMANAQSTVAQELESTQGGKNEDGTYNWDTQIDGVSAADKVRQDTWDEAVKLEVQVQKAKELGITLSSEDTTNLQNNKKMIVTYYFNNDRSLFLASLKEMGLTEKDYDKIQEDALYASKLQEKMFADDPSLSEATDEEISKELNDKYYRAKHILVKDPSSDPTTNEDGTTTPADVTAEEAQQAAKTKIESVLARLEGGEDFDAVMNEVSEDGRGEDGALSSPDGYLFQDNGQMVQPFVDATKALAIGDYTKEPVRVETPYKGYHIVKRVPFIDADKETAKSEIKNSKYDALVEKWVSEATITKKEGKINRIKVGDTK